MYSWVHENLEVRPNEVLGGEGVFAKSPLEKGDRLIVFGGHIMTLAEEQSLPNDITDLGHQIDNDLVIGIKDQKSVGLSDRINHSCNPNSGFKGQIMLVAMRDIFANEEITFDYAMTLGGEPLYELECRCGTRGCRKVITSLDWQIPDLQEKYRGYFQYYLEQKIQNHKKAL